MTASYQTMNGAIANADDPQRAVWYGICTYWTDDWTKLDKSFHGIPACPICKHPGFYSTAESFLRDTDDYVYEYKEKCLTGDDLTEHMKKVRAAKEKLA